MSVSMATSGWRGYFLPLKAVCILATELTFFPSLLTHLLELCDLLCNVVVPVIPTTHSSLPLPLASLFSTHTCKLTYPTGASCASSAPALEIGLSSTGFTSISASPSPSRNQTCHLPTQWALGGSVGGGHADLHL